MIKFSQESLEDLIIAIVSLKTETGLITNILPEHVLNDEMMKQIPKVLPLFQDACSLNHLKD